MNRNIRELRNTIVNERKITSPLSRSPNPRTSLLFNAESPLKNSGFLTKSVGFNVSPLARESIKSNLNPNMFNLKLGFNNTTNKSINDEYHESPLTDRSPTQNQRNSAN